MPAMRNSYDALIIGGGHNGLVCACYLAQAGLKTIILERRRVVGGAAVTEEFFPGFRNSTASYTVSLLHPKVIRDLRLLEHGLQILERPFANFLPLSDQQYLKIGGGLEASQQEIARYSSADAERLPYYYQNLQVVAELIRDLLLHTPPNVGGGVSELIQAFKVGKRLKQLSMTQRRDLLDFFSLSAGDMLDSWFSSAPIKAAFGFDAVVGNYASPYAPGSAYVLLHHVFGEVNGKRGVWGHALGGMGAITQYMAQEARARGVEIRTEAPVQRVNIRSGRAQSVLLHDGTEIAAKCIVANVNPKLLYQQLIDQADLDAEFLQRMNRYRCASGTLRINVALSELPNFSCLPGISTHHQSGIIIAPSLAYMERAYFDARQSGWSASPIIEMLIPSTVDPSLAPQGKHVASLFCQHFAPQLPQGDNWDEKKVQAVDCVFNTMARYAPNFKASILGYRAYTPLDLEREFGLIGGDIFHGALQLNQLFSARPLLGYGHYRGPLRGLYICGSGTHPGGGVTGVPGHNAAREIIRDFRRSKV